MKLLLGLVLLYFSPLLNAQKLDSLVLEGHTLLYYKVPSTSLDQKGVVVYMHGGVSQFKGLKKSTGIPIEALLEGNLDFVPTMNQAGYDVVLPIAFNEYNWLTENGADFIKAIVHPYRNADKSVFVAGFSDGGTGAYRMFYQNPAAFDGLLVFNGFPQLDNFQRKVDYTTVTNRPVVFAATFGDKTIPYEFLMVEYRRQQMLNEHTFLWLREGKHAFGAYEGKDFEKCLELLQMKTKKVKAEETDLIWVYPPVDALVIDGEVEAFYPFRKSKGKVFSMVPQEYARTDYKHKDFAKLLSKGSKVVVHPVQIKRSKLKTLEHIVFTYEVDGVSHDFFLVNWLNSSAW